MKYSEVSKFLNKVYGEKDFNKNEKEFMEAIRSILFWLTYENDHERPMDNSYDSSSVLYSIQKLIENFNAVYHFANVTTTWTEEDDKENE